LLLVFDDFYFLQGGEFDNCSLKWGLGGEDGLLVEFHEPIKIDHLMIFKLPFFAVYYS
jgi:hypothetical protein